MRIELAQKYGFCFGVKRAIKIAEEHQNASTYGPLIHNALEIKRLEKNYNVGLVEDFREFRPGDTAIVRTHGIPKSELEALNETGVEVVDATCPYVTKPQQICEQMSKEGYDIVIFGDERHPEIKGVKSYASGNVVVVSSIEDVSSAKLGERVALVAQTTRKVEEYLEIASYLIPRRKELRVFNTICNATFENQEAARKLAKRADVMIVIGGKNSSNTKQLFAIAKSYCKDSYHIEDKLELECDWFRGKQLCGITAGASTPDWVIQEVVDRIEQECLYKA